jgi:hypothetical protein
MEKWFKYKIDYEYGLAELWAKDRIKNPLDKFYDLASMCFGIRKSIGQISLISEEFLPITEDISTPVNDSEHIMKNGMGDYMSTMLHSLTNKSNSEKIKMDKVYYILAHSGGDIITFTKRGIKIKSE